MNAVFNHLWQSSVFICAVALAAWTLRRNPPRTRYWLWLAASLKYLIPFSLFVSAGTRIQLPPDTPSLHAVTVQQISNYFGPLPGKSGSAFVADGLRLDTGARRHLAFGRAVPLSSMALAMAGTSSDYLRRQRRSVRLSGPDPLLFGSNRAGRIWSLSTGTCAAGRPCGELTPGQLDTVIAHELRHIRCHDNLTAALQMCVESVFWFHPLVWWIGARLMNERERDCDEAVLAKGAAPGEYARGILQVCRSYVALPGSCAAGICGSDLKKRILGIMTWRASIPNSSRVRAALVTGAMAAVAIPFVIGILRAQSLPPEPAYKYGVVFIHKSAPGATGSRWEAVRAVWGGDQYFSTLDLLKWACQEFSGLSAERRAGMGVIRTLRCHLYAGRT